MARVVTTAGFYHCSVKGVGRTDGRSIVAAAAYRSGEQLYDEITGQYADYRARNGVVDKFIITRADAPAWAQDRSQLWNGAERSEKRANGKLATEIELALPHELSAEMRKALVATFARTIVERYGVAADVAIHEPGREGDHRNHHAHILITHRMLDADGFVLIEKGQRRDRGLSKLAEGPKAIVAIRREWEQFVNLAYERAGLDIRVDHRSHEDRKIPQEPTIHLGPVATEIERNGGHSDRGDINRDIEKRNAEREQLAALGIKESDISSEIQAAQAATRTPEPQPPIFDRDRENDEWEQAVAAAAIAAAEKAEKATGEKQNRPAATKSASARPAIDADLWQKELAAQRADEQERAATARAPERALSKTQGEIRLAVRLTSNANGMAAALEDRGIMLCEVREPELARRAKYLLPQLLKEREKGVWSLQRGGVGQLNPDQLASASEAYKAYQARKKKAGKEAKAFNPYVKFVQDRRNDQIEELQRQANASLEVDDKNTPILPTYFKKGDIVAVNLRGEIYGFNRRSTGIEDKEKLTEYLAPIDRLTLMSVTDAQEVARDVKQHRETEWWKSLPPNSVERRIAKCAEMARLSGGIIVTDLEGRQVGQVAALADRLFNSDDDRQTQIKTVHGVAAIAARLEGAGIAFVRLTAADVTALAALRRDEEMAQEVAAENLHAHKPRQFADKLVEGDLAAVTRRHGEVYRIDTDKLGDAKQVLTENLPSMMKVRAEFEAESELKTALWDERRAQRAKSQEAYARRGKLRQFRRKAAKTARSIERETQKGIGSVLKGIFAPIANLFKAAEHVLEVFDGGDPVLTPQEEKRTEQAAKERRAETIDGNLAAEREAHKQRLLAQIRRDNEQQRLQARGRGNHDQVDRGHGPELERGPPRA
jgi:hypothetical protein